MSRPASFSRPLLQHPRSLPDGQPDPRPMLYGLRKNVPRFSEFVASVEHRFNSLIVFRPPLDLVDVAVVGIERIVGFFVGPMIVRHRLIATNRRWSAGRISNCWIAVLIALSRSAAYTMPTNAAGDALSRMAAVA
jgi:hypothetical protein